MTSKDHREHQRRGLGRQALQRTLEQEIRREAVAFTRWCRRCGLGREQTAQQLQVNPLNLSRWEQQWREDRLRVQPRGRPLAESDVATRQQVLVLFGLMGARLGVPALRKIFPDMARAELEDLVRDAGEDYRKYRRGLLHVLGWKRCGAVWAMDFAEPPLPIDDVYPHLLVVRDLSSGRQLLALPVKAETAEVAANALMALILEHGPPLVLKIDNDPAFTAKRLRSFLDGWGIVALYSPPYTPSYNGACEAGIGGLKTRAHHEAARHGRPGEWTCDDVEAARLMANETARPWGRREPTPDEAWETRSVITLEEREEFHDTVNRFREEVVEEWNEGLDGQLRLFDPAAVDRVAISRALIEHGILELKRRRYSLPNKRRSA